MCAFQEQYFNRKERHTINNQVVIDGKQCIVDLETGYPGSMHDPRVFRRSELARRLENGQLLQLLAWSRVPKPNAPAGELQFRWSHSISYIILSLFCLHLLTDAVLCAPQVILADSAYPCTQNVMPVWKRDGCQPLAV